jgi:hypothetical protein
MNKIDKSLVQVGSDFEMFLIDKNGDFISAIPFNPGTKSSPQKLSKEGCCIQRDGVLQECNVPPVLLNQADLFAKNVEFVKNFIVENVCKEKGLELVCCPSATFKEDQLQDIEATTFGCDPDYNAWLDGDINEKPNPTDNKGLRSCGGHIHLSYSEADLFTSMNLMKLFDLFLTVPFIIIDEDTERRKLYGKAGAFRLQNWGDVQGFEARTLSNFWIKDSALIKYVFQQLDKMFDYYNEHGISEVDKDSLKIINAINDQNVELVYELLEKYKIEIPEFELTH